MSFEPYLWIKALHVAAAITFVAGVLNVSWLLAAGRLEGAALARAVRPWDQRVTTPAMLLVWALGLTLALAGGWFRSGWLVAKLAFVAALSALHGVQSGKLRRLVGGATVGKTSRLNAPAVIGCAVAIAILVVVKPR